MQIHQAAAKGFQSAADSYERGRPDYPEEALSFLMRTLNITPGRRFLDLGAGTGKFTKYLLQTSAEVIAVEPVEGMRQKLSELYPGVSVLSGTAEEIPLPDNSIDGVIVAQAFHWFNGEKALPEIHRILKSGGKLGLIWNARDESVDWVSKLTDIIDPHEKGAPRYKSGAWKKAFEKTPLFSPLRLQSFRHLQKGPPEMLEDRITSISFISALDSSSKKKVVEQVRHLLSTHPALRGQSTMELPYRTDVFLCERQ